MQKIALFVNRDRDIDLSATKEVVSILKKFNKDIILDADLKSDLDIAAASYVNGDSLFKNSHMVIALGGDGTILKTVNHAAEYNVPVMGINLGHLGFLTQAERDDLSNLVKILEGEFSVEYRMMLEARVVKDGKVTESFTALNDIIIRSNSAKMISLEAKVDETSAGRYLADGVIIATSTGSTAYSLSCGGPIVHKALDCMIMNPICPHSMKSRCIVVPPDSRISIDFDATYCNEVDLRIDGVSTKLLGADEYVDIVRSEKRVPLINVNSRDYFDVIRQKLSD